MAITISGENNNDRILAADGVIDQISGINFSGIITASHINVGDNIQLGNAGIITATTFVGNLTGNVNSTSPLLLQTGGSERFRITGNNELGIAGANYGSSGQVLTSGGSGSAVSWVTPAVTAFTNGSNNRVVTATSGSGLNGEANLTFSGSVLGLNQPSVDTNYVLDANGGAIFTKTGTFTSNDFNKGHLTLRNTTASQGAFLDFRAASSGGAYGVIAKIGGFNTYSGSGYDGALTFSTRQNSTNTMVEKLRITTGGDMLLGNHGSRIFDDSSGTNVVVDIYGGTTAGKRGILALGGRTGSDNADIGTIQFLNENNANATASNHVQSKLVASIDVKSETSNSNASANSGGHLIFSTKGENAVLSERIRITSSGLLKVNSTDGSAWHTIRLNTTTNNAIKDVLHVHSSVDGATAAAGYGVRLNFSGEQLNGNEYTYGGIAGLLSSVGSTYGDLAFYTNNNGTLGERLRITSGGQVNIGGDYTQTAYNLSVTNTGGNLFRIKTASEGDYDLRFMVQNSESNIWHYGTDDFVFGNRYDRKLHFITNGSKRLTINGNYIGINETLPNTYLHIKGTGEMLRLETTASGGGQCYIDFDDETATRASIGMRGSSSDTLTIAALNAGLRFDVQNATQALLINSNGCLQHGTASGVSYFTGSSEYIFGSTTSSPPAGGYESILQVHTSKTRSAFTLAGYNNNAGGPFMTFLTSRSTTRGTLGGTIGSADTLGEIRFTGDNGTNYNSLAIGARISAKAASAPGSGDQVIAGRLMFATGAATAASGSTNTVMELREDGHLYLKRGRVNDNGSVLYCWGGYIAGTGTLSFDVPVFTAGNIYRIDAFYSHHSLSYGAYKYGIYGAYSGHGGLQINNDISSQSSSNNGSWTITRGSAGQPIVIAKTAGTYNGGGYYFVNVYAGYYTAL